MSNNQATALIGNTGKRPVWIGQGGGKLPTYEGPIPMGDVERLLFDWEAISVPTGNFIPVGVEEIGQPGVILLPDGRPARAMVNEKAQAIVRSDDFSELGRHSTGYRMHDYKQWLLRDLSNILQDRLVINSALTLKNGAQAAVDIALDETMHDGLSGASFWGGLLARTSLDGSLSTTYSAHCTIIACDNMFQGVEGRAKADGRQFKVRHTANSLQMNHHGGVREALHIIERSVDGMMDFLHALTPVKVTRPQWLKVMDIIEPPAELDSSKVALTKSDNRREQLDAVYTRDPMVAQWTGTAFGVVQAVNTYEHHYRNVRGTSRLERDYDRAIRDDFAKADGATLSALASVLDMPELAMA